MSIWMFLKVFGDLCVLFAVLGAFPTVIVYHSSLIIPAVICAFGAGIAAGLQDSGRGNLRWLGAAFPGVALYLACINGEFWIVFPAVVYTLLAILRGQLYLEYAGYRQTFRICLRLLGVWYLILCMFSFVEEMSFNDIRYIREEVTLRLGLIYCFLGVILLRQLRLGTDSIARGSSLQLAAVLVGAGSVIAGFLAAVPVLREGAAAVIQAILFAVMGIFVFFYERFIEADYAGTHKALEEAWENSDEIRVQPEYQQMIQQHTQAVEKEPSYWWVLLVVAVAIVVGILLFRTFSRKRSAVGSEEAANRIDTPQQNQKDNRRTNRGRVRHYYREYLRYEQKRGLRLKKYDTSGDILRKSDAGTDKAAAAALREIYLRARYDEQNEVTREQAEQARALLKKIRGGGGAA